MKFFIKKLKQQYHIQDYNFILIALVLAISIVGIFVVGSAKDSYQFKQLLGVLIGFVAMVIVSLIDYEWILKFYWLLYIVNLVLLVAVLLFGVEANGATRWLNLGFIQFQPSDLTKILMILFFYISLNRKHLDILTFQVKSRLSGFDILTFILTFHLYIFHF